MGLFGNFFSSASGAHDITVQDAYAAVQSGRAVLVDVRERAEYEEERIEGALFYPLSSFQADALPSGGAVIFFCVSGMRSARAVAACHSAGMSNCSNMAGGIMAWKQAGFLTVKE